jgi:tetratricopeptide (TPR) repeat protein
MHLRGSQRRPLLCTIEDLHWIDTTSEEYVATLVDRLREAAIMLVVTYRPDYCPPWVDRSHQIALGQLATHEAVTVVRSNSAHTALPEPVVEMIITKAEGNPFFLEELTRAVVAQAHFPAEGTVPDTIQGVLMARIDRLPEEAKRLLQTASVLGREFSLRLVQALWDSRGRPDPWLRELTRQEFLYQALGAAEPVYVFKHALTQDVAYTSLLTARRQALHAAAGRALEGLYADHLEEVYDRLAYHYAQTEEATKAVTYLTYVAEKALAQYARDAALTALQEAGRHAARLHGTARDHHVLDLVIRQGWVLEELGHAQEALDLLSQQQACVERLHEPVHTANYYQCLGFLYNRLGAWEPALQSAQRALAEASQGRNDAAVGRAHYLLMMLHAFIGQPRQGLVYGEQAMPLLEQTHEWYALGRVHFWFAFMAVRFGDFDRALQSAARAEALGATIGDRRLQCQAAQMAQLTYVTQGDWDRALTWGQRALELATGQRDTTWSTAVLGDTHLEQGNVATALTLLEQGALQWGYFQPRQTQGWFLAWLGEAYLAAGQFARAHELVLQGLAYTLDAKYWIGVGIAQRALGRVTRASGALPEAATHLHRALHTFTAHEYRPEQARTHLDLAAVAQAQGDVQAATTHLRAAQRLFTAMQAAAYVERTVQLAHAYAIPLAPESREQQPGSDPAR